MDNDFSEKLMQVLSNPEAMSKITAIASGLGKPIKNQPEAEAVATEIENRPQENGANIPDAFLQTASLNPDPRLLLLNSLKPLLREEKRDRIDAITRALALANAMMGFRK